MFPDNSQLGSNSVNGKKVDISKGVKKNYPQLLEQLILQEKQRELSAKYCYPWQINCKRNSPYPPLRPSI